MDILITREVYIVSVLQIFKFNKGNGSDASVLSAIV